MTEAEWLTCSHPKLMLEFLERKASNRKLRLFVCACCRRIWQLLPPELQAGVEVSERYADGQATAAERGAAFTRSEGVTLAIYSGGRSPDALAYATNSAAECAGEDSGTLPPTLSAASTAANAAALAAAEALAAEMGDDHDFDSTVDSVYGSEVAIQSSIVRDVFGNPFRPVAIERSWLSTAVVSLAQIIYDERAFDNMPELADALEETGCTNSDILEHCRGSGPHVRGCWVIDLLLRKE